MAALRIPKAFLGYEEGVGSKATLAAEDVRFARTIQRVQKILTSELAKIAIVHLYTQGFEDAELLNFELELQNPSVIFDQEKLELMSQKIDLATSAKDARLFSNQWIYENVFELNIDEMKDLNLQLLEDTKNKFRLDQIEMEGNDPAKSGQKSDEEGVPPQARRGEWGGSERDLGRNEEYHWGRDKLGKDGSNPFKPKSKEDPNKGKFKGGSPLAISKGSTAVSKNSYNSILDGLKKIYGKRNGKDTSLLNEKIIIDEENTE